jgi:hypothetical protein
MAQEISQHVRNKLCKFFNTNKTEHSTATCTITSNEAEKAIVGALGAESAEPSTSQTSTKTFPLITPDSIKYPSVENDKVSESPTEGLDLLDSNFTDMLLPNAFQINTNNDGKEFGTVIGEIDNNDQQVVEILFSCKLCEFR